MKTQVIKEEPILHYRGCQGDFGCIAGECDLEIYADDLRQAQVGDEWSVQDQDQCPNASEFWTISYKVIYKDESGLGILYDNDGEKTLIWVELK